MFSQIPPGHTDPRVSHLMAEIEHVETRPVEELGIPTFLVAEDLTEGAPAPSRTSDAADELGVSFARLAVVFASCKPELEVSDVAKLIQVLANRRFPAVGMSPLIDESLLPASDDETLPPPSVLLSELTEGMKCSRAVRAVNYHATPRYREAEYRDQIAAYARAFEPITPTNFASALDGSWPHVRPWLDAVSLRRISRQLRCDATDPRGAWFRRMDRDADRFPGGPGRAATQLCRRS